MSPSLVYLKDQDEVSLAFAQVAYAIHWLIAKYGEKKFVSFLTSLKTSTFSLAFMKSYGMSPDIFESTWQADLGRERWEKTQGTISDEVRFSPLQEVDLVGAETQAKIRLGDRMRARGYLDAALVEYEKALSEEPDNAVVLLKAARTYAALGQKDKVTPLLQRAVDKNPNYVTPYIDLAALKEGEEAVSLLLEANAINPFVPDIHRLLAENYKKLGKTDDAMREDQIAKELAR
jgi:tetratricopeptide (TPR) repeat protein